MPCAVRVARRHLRVGHCSPRREYPATENKRDPEAERECRYHPQTGDRPVVALDLVSCFLDLSEAYEIESDVVVDVLGLAVRLGKAIVDGVPESSPAIGADHKTLR